MAVRPLVNIERLTTAHVNSVDGSMTYESGVAYNANTTVSYNGSLYTANVDIEDSDSNTPDAAPDKWSMTINAPDSQTSGDISALAARVTALEETVGDDTDGLVKDVDDLKETANIKIVDVTATAEVGDTIIEACTRLMDALVTYCQSMDDDYVFEPILINVPIVAGGSMIAFHGTNIYLSNAETDALRIDISELRVIQGDLNIETYCARLGATGQTNKTMMKHSTSSGVTTSLANTVLTSGGTMLVRGLLYKKID